MKILSHTYDEFVELVESFHSYPAPGVIIGGFMVDAAIKQLPKGILYEAVSETRACLPDAVQLLTPCTIGNGRIKVYDMSIYALSLYDKFTGEGVRVYLDSEKLDSWSELKTWLYKLKPKSEQDSAKLANEIKEAGGSICSSHPITIKPELLGKKSKGQIGNCPSCKVPYPVKDGEICLAWQGEAPYK